MTASQEFWEQVNSLVTGTQSKELKFRLYYCDHGRPIVYTMEELDGNYIEVDRLTYLEASMNVRVQDKKLIKINTPTFKKLSPSTVGTPCHPDNVAVVVTQDQPHILWSLHVSN